MDARNADGGPPRLFDPEPSEITTPDSPGVTTLARLLTLVAGYVDAVGFVTLVHLFTAHQSGNSDGLGVALSGGDWTTAWRRASAIGAFLVGVALGTVIVEHYRRRRPGRAGAAVSTVELVALSASLCVGLVAAPAGRILPADSGPYAAVASLLACAMGLQNTMLRRAGARNVWTTFITGVLTNMAEAFVVALYVPRGVRRARLRRTGSFFGSIVVLYLLGAIAGAAAARAWGFGALGAPVALVGAVVVWELRVGYEPTLPDGTSRVRQQSG